MRLDINLATRPYEDARQFWARWGLGVSVLALGTALLIGFAARGWMHAGHDRKVIHQLQQEIAERENERAKAQAYLDLPANRSTRDQSQYLNSLIERKAFSWTRVFEDLEKVMPSRLHVVALKPELNDDNQLLLQLKVAGENRTGALELVHRMEGSPHFLGTQLVQEGQGSENTAGVSAQIQALYIPDQDRSKP